MAGPKNSRCAERPSAGAVSLPPSPDLSSLLSAFLGARLAPGDRLCVALSGGRDSVVLLHALSRLAAAGRLPVPLSALSALHVHHGLSPHADAWAAFCAAFCADCGVPLAVERVSVPRASGEGLEAAARRLRHRAFAACAADWLALAHHRDDQAETVLLNLLRGAGVAGAAGMLAERPQPAGPALIRPLLDAARTAIDDYAATHGLSWIDDESNADTYFRRNFLRREIMPALAAHFPGAAPALARAASHFAEAAHLLDDLAALDRAALAAPDEALPLAAFNALAPARARNLLRGELLAAGFRAPDTRWMDEALRQLARAGGAAETCMATADGELHVYRGRLYPVPRRAPLPEAPQCWAGEAELPWGDGCVRFVARTGAGIAQARLAQGELRLQVRMGGERLQPDARRPRRPLRKLLQEGAVPPWERGRLPYLWCGERLVWVGGFGVDAAFACPPGEAGIVPLWEGGALSGDSGAQ